MKPADGGATLGFNAYGSDASNNATATKDGNTYKITGTASPVPDLGPATAGGPRHFEIDVTCP